MAVQGRHVEVAKLLIDSGADVAATNTRGETALHLASVSGHVEAVELLIDSGADVAACNMYGVTALQMACIHGRADLARLLLPHPRSSDYIATTLDAETDELVSPQAFSVESMFDALTDAVGNDRRSCADVVVSRLLADLSVLEGQKGMSLPLALACSHRSASLWAVLAHYGAAGAELSKLKALTAELMDTPVSCFFGEDQFCDVIVQLTKPDELVQAVAGMLACHDKPLDLLRSLVSRADGRSRAVLRATVAELYGYMALHGCYTEQLAAMQYVVRHNVLGLAEQPRLQPTLQRLRDGAHRRKGYVQLGDLAYTVLSSGAWDFQMMARLALAVRVLLLLPLVNEALAVRGSAWAWAGIVVGAAVLLHEAQEAYADFAVWLQSLWNAADVLSALSLLACCALKIAAPVSGSAWQVSIQWTMIATLLLLLLRSAKRVATGSTLGPILRVMQRMLGTVLRLLGLSILLVAALAIPLFILFRDDMEMEDMWGMLLVVPELTVGGFGELEGLMQDEQLQVSGQLIKLVGMVTIDLLLVNLLIAVMSEQYQPDAAASEAALSNLSELLEHHSARRHGVLPAPLNLLGYACWAVGLRKPYRVKKEDVERVAAKVKPSAEEAVEPRADECELHWGGLLVIHCCIRPIQMMTASVPLALSNGERIEVKRRRTALGNVWFARWLLSQGVPVVFSRLLPLSILVHFVQWLHAAGRHVLSRCRRRARVEAYVYTEDTGKRQPHLDGERAVRMWLHMLQRMQSIAAEVGGEDEAEEGKGEAVGAAGDEAVEGGKAHGGERKGGEEEKEEKEEEKKGADEAVVGSGAGGGSVRSGESAGVVLALQEMREAMLAMQTEMSAMKNDISSIKSVLSTAE
eukprot:PLAT2543.9.p1 GENE.PLAT2543.9~~PLAT2543.9.p1  ORF type:complete len:881 (+),score=272.04 PLAT2543.9:57-2645(+)